VSITLTLRTVRRTGLAGAAVLTASALTACGAGFDAQTTQPYQAAEGTNGQTGELAVRNVLVLADEEGKGELYGAIVNTGDTEDHLTGIQVGSSQQGVTVSGMRTFTLRAGQSLMIPPAGGKPVEVTGAKPGTMLKLTLVFGDAAPLTATVPVLTTDHYSPTPRPETSEAHG
jgi:hypothetical protein